jgi:hypothetical protein
MSAAPAHYQRAIRRLLRFAVAGIAIGLILGLVWTDVRKTVRYGEAPGPVAQAGSKATFQLPPGLMFEAGLDFKLSHGHVILVAGVLPLCFALALHLTHAHGGREIGAPTLAWFTWLYLPGAGGALALMVYKGYAGFEAVRRAATSGEPIALHAIDQGLFFGSRALRAACYGLSHSAMAIGAFVLLWALWRAAGTMGEGRAS